MTRTGIFRSNIFLIIDSIEDVIPEIFVSEVEKMTFPLLRYVLTSWKESSKNILLIFA